MKYLDASILGIFSGSAYALVAVSITLMFRSTGVLSFAHAAFATTGAYFYYDFSVQRGWSRPLAALLALLLTVAYGLVIERFVVRRVRGAPTATKLIATLGVVALTTGLMLQRYGFEPIRAPWLLPDESIELRRLKITYQQVAMLVTAGASAGLLGWFLRETRFGIAIRGVAQNAEASRLMGVSLPNVARFNWGVGALLAGATGILTAPLAPITAASSVLLLVKALTGTLLGGLGSLPLAFAGGIAVGVVQAITVVRTTAPGAQDLATLLLVVGILVARRSWALEIQDESVPAAGARRFKVPRPVFLDQPAFKSTARAAGLAVVGLFAVLAIVMPLQSFRWAFVGGIGLFYVIEALSLVLLVGWSGQVSLMQGAYVGIGAFLTAFLVETWGWPLEAAIPAAALCGVGLGAIAGLPALRLTGLQFGIASLAFGGAASEWLFQQGFPRQFPRGELFGVDLFNDTSLYFIMLPITLLLYLLVWNVRRSTYGPLLISSRDASATVAHFGADPKRTRMWGFLLASFIASLGGAFYGILLTGFSPTQFSLILSMQLLVFAVVGGLQSMSGPIVAGIMFGVVPEVIKDIQGGAKAEATAIPDIVAGLLLVMLVAWRPDGLASLFRRAKATVPGKLSFGRWELVMRDRRAAPVRARRASSAHPDPAARAGRSVVEAQMPQRPARGPRRPARRTAPVARR